MACWASVLCRRTLRHRLGNGCRQSSSKQGLEALSFAEKSSLKRPSTSRWILKPLSHSCHHPRDVLRSGGSKQNTCDGASQGKEVCCCCCTAFSCFKIEPSNTDNNLGIVANSSILSSRHKSRKLEHEDHCEDTHLRKPKVPYCEHTPTCFTPLFFPLHLLNWTKTFSCASHFYIPKATQISRFSSQPSKDPVTQNAPKDNPGATGPTGLLPPPTRSALSLEPRPKGIVGYIISRYTWYIERLQHSLESEMPRTFRMFRIFSVGLKTFIKDFTGYVRVLVKLSFPSERLENLTLHQLQLYHFMPYDMFKVFPVLAISAIPFGQNLALPFGYLFPRQLLCRHFWDLQQSHDFAMRDLRKRVLYARPVFRCLQASVAGIEPLNDRVRMQSVCHLLGSGRHPRDTQVMELRQLFSAAPYGLKNIKRHHVHSLLRLHDLSAVRSRKRLRDHARWLLCHDFALTVEARGVPATDATSQRQDQGVDSSSVEGSGQSPLQQCDLASLHVNVLKTSLLLRGISPIGLDSSGMVRVMERWLAVSLQLSCADSSLLLHLPILLFYNHPTNLALVAR